MSKTNLSFLCLGLIMRDILITGVPELPSHWEQTLVGAGIQSDTGGGAANSARTFGKLGAKVAISGRLGQDSFGAAVREDLSRDGVELSLLKEIAGYPSGVAVALIREDGKRCFTTVRGANKTYCKEDLSAIDWKQFPFVHINGYFQFPALEADLPGLLQEAKSAGCTVSFDTASWDPAGRWFQSIRPFAPAIDYFFANDSQLAQLTGRENLKDAAAFLQAEGVGNVVAKLGDKGSVTFGKDGAVTVVSAYPIQAADTTGAGDSFDAAYMLAVAQGWSAKDAAQLANTVAGQNCSKIGATAGVPDYETAVKLCREFYGEPETGISL